MQFFMLASCPVLSRIAPKSRMDVASAFALMGESSEKSIVSGTIYEYFCICSSSVSLVAIDGGFVAAMTTTPERPPVI